MYRRLAVLVVNCSCLCLMAFLTRSASFLCQVAFLTFVSLIVFFAIRRTQKWRLLGLTLAGGIWALLYTTIPFDVMIRDAPTFDWRFASVVHVAPQRFDSRDPSKVNVRIGCNNFREIRWALVISFPSKRRIVTPLFQDPDVPYLVGPQIGQVL